MREYQIPAKERAKYVEALTNATSTLNQTITWSLMWVSKDWRKVRMLGATTKGKKVIAKGVTLSADLDENAHLVTNTIREILREEEK